MAWWDVGLQGTRAFMGSAAINQPAYAAHGYSQTNCPSPVVIAGFALNPNAADGSNYKILLNTFSKGTQLYMDVNVSFLETGYFSGTIPGWARIAHHALTLQLRDSGGNYYNIGSNAIEYLIQYWPLNAPADLEFSIYGYNYGKYGADIPPAGCFPFAGANGALTSQLICVCNSSGVSFYIAGYSTSMQYSGDPTIYEYQCPCNLCGQISATYLNNANLFDPNVDALKPEDGGNNGFGEGGNIPSLPVSPSYPGTDMDFPTLPTGANAFGFSRLTLYKPTAANLASALDILYSDSDESTLETIIESCKKWWYKPEQYCISLMISPVDAATSGSKNIKFGKYDSEVSAPCVSSQWHITDCGTINVPLKYGSFLDFEPHAKIKIYLPFIGLRSLNANEVIGSTIAIKYYTDILSGVSVCMLKVTRTGSNNTILYTYDCNVNMQVPMTSENYNTVISNLLSAGVTAGVAATTGGMGLAALGTAGAVGGMASAASGIGSPDLTQSGNLSPNSGVLCYPKPYICVQMPIPTTPSNYNNEKGRPSNIYMELFRCSGKTIVSDLHVDIAGATDTEKEQIRQAFRRGVYM